MSNVFDRLRSLLPLPPVLVGTVREINADDTSTVEIPTGVALREYAENVAAGALIRVRGTTVPIGSRAFIRAGVIESQAPDGDVLSIPVGTIVLKP